MKNEYLEKVARTAYGVAHARTFTDILLSRQVLMELNKILKESIERGKDRMARQLIPFFEARYLLTDKLLRKNHIHQTLEIGSGLSMRGVLAATMGESFRFRYVEIDQPEMVALKKMILANLSDLIKSRERSMGSEGWHLIAGDALDPRCLNEALNYFLPDPIAFVNEGFLLYLKAKQRALYSTYVRPAIARSKGIWIADVITKHSFSTVPGYRKVKLGWYQRIGRNLDDDTFTDVESAMAFFKKQGFWVEIHWLSEMMEDLVSPERLDLSRSFVRDMLDTCPLFVMRPR